MNKRQLSVATAALLALFAPVFSAPQVAAAAYEAADQVKDSGSGDAAPSGKKSAIGDFDRLLATVTKISVRPVSKSGGLLEMDVPAGLRTLDLAPLARKGAGQIQWADLPAGTYSKVYLHTGDITGYLKKAPSTPVEVRRPGGKLQIGKPFEVTSADKTVKVIFDVRVTPAGNGGGYILQAAIARNIPDRPARKDTGPNYDDRNRNKDDDEDDTKGNPND